MRTALRLEVPVRTLEGKELLPPGTLLTPGVIEELASGRNRVLPRETFLAYGSIRSDLERYCRQGHYRTIFETGAAYRDLEGIMGTVRIPLPCLGVLEHFKKRDVYTYRHSLMVFALSCLLTGRMGRRGAEFAAGVMAGPLHDIGKLCVPLSVLRKGTPLLRGERALLEQHPAAGYALLSWYLQDPGTFTGQAARDHHERRDGTGYPRGISLRSRLVEVVAACDIYDALISPRPYRREPFDNRTALEELTDMARRGRIGWDAVTLLVAQNRRDKPSPGKCRVSLEKRGRPPEGNLYGLFTEGPPAGK